MCSNAFTPRCACPTCAARPRTSTRRVIAPRLACQTTPPVGSGVSIATALGSISSCVAQVAGAGDAAGLLVAHQVDDDPPRRRAARARARPRRRRAARRARPSCRRCRAPRCARPRGAAANCARDWAGTTSKWPWKYTVRGPAPACPRTTHGSSSSRLGGSSTSSGCEAETRHRVAQQPTAAAEVAARRVLRVERDELLDERRHLVGARLEPRLHLGHAIHAAHHAGASRPRPRGRYWSAPSRLPASTWVAAASAGTHTVSAPGSISMRSLRTFSRSPPSSS